MKQNEVKIAEYLLKIKAVRLSVDEPFTWSSGWRSPVYCDNRLLLSYPSIRNDICDAFVGMIREKYPNATGVAGVATAGIAHAALIAAKMELPLIYVRSKAKGHGLQNMIEGRLDPDLSYVVVEDLISTGGSSVKAVEAVQSAGAKVAGTVAIFSYGFEQATKRYADSGSDFHTLTKLEHLLQKAVEINYLRPEELATIYEWQKAPDQWPALS